MSKDKAKPQNVAMYEREWRYVKEMAQRLGISVSAALRVIVNEHAQVQNG